MTEFRVGDKVRFTSTDDLGPGAPTVGSIGVIMGLPWETDEFYRIQFDGFPWAEHQDGALYLDREFELVEEAIDPIQDAKDQAYAAGYKAGLADGEEAGYETGRNAGFNDWYERGQEANGW